MNLTINQTEIIIRCLESQISLEKCGIRLKKESIDINQLRNKFIKSKNLKIIHARKKYIEESKPKYKNNIFKIGAAKK